MKKSAPRHYEPITCEFEGETYSGSFYVENGCVTVTTTNWGTKGDAYGSLGPKEMAKHLLRELLVDAKRKRMQEIQKLEKQLRSAELELGAWKRHGSKIHIISGSSLVKSFDAALKKLYEEKP